MKRKVTGYFTEEQAKKVISKGVYCYDENGTCPFWEMRTDKREQENGYCHWLQEGDWEEKGSSLLWDQCKKCGINDDLEEDELGE